MSEQKPVLLLLPNLIAEHKDHKLFLPESVDKAVSTVDGLIAESDQAARRYLSRFSTKKPVSEIVVAVYNKNTPDEDIDFYLEPILKGERWGLLSDSGLPCIADPGSKLVQRAKVLGIVVQAFVGPSSILLALMQSGLNGQSFTFHGYLPKESDKLHETLRRLSSESKRIGRTQIFMERPYCNKKTFEALIEVLDDTTLLCVAAEITGKDQMIVTQSIKNWKKSPPPNLDKRNALFLFL